MVVAPSPVLALPEARIAVYRDLQRSLADAPLFTSKAIGGGGKPSALVAGWQAERGMRHGRESSVRRGFAAKRDGAGEPGVPRALTPNTATGFPNPAPIAILAPSGLTRRNDGSVAAPHATIRSG